MSHEAHHEEHHEGPEIDITKSKPAFSASFWFMLILAGLFIASLNFVNVMGKPEEGHGGHGGSHGTKTEMPAGGGHHTESGEAEMEGGHGDAVHPATSTNDQKGDTAAGSSSENHH